MPVSRKLGSALLRSDPTRTLTLRRQFAARLKQRFALLKGRIVTLLATEDALGLSPRKLDPLVITNCAGGQMRDASTGRCGPGIGISIDRKDMPQIPDVGEFVQWARGQGIGVTTQREYRAEELSPTQANFRQERVDAIPDDHGKPVLVSQDRYVLDGTHRWVKAWQKDPKTWVLTVVIGLPLRPALELLRRYPGAKFVENFDADQPRGPDGKWLSAAGGAVADTVKEVYGDAKELTAAGVKRVSDLLDKIPGVAYLRGRAKAMNAKMAARYGRKTAMAILASGQVFSWGAAGVGAVMGVPVYVPSLAAMAPALAMAELKYQVKHRLTRNEAGDSDEGNWVELLPEDIDRLGREFYEELKRDWESAPTTNTRWAASSSPEQLSRFKEWLRSQIGATLAGADERRLWDEYVRRGFAKGAGRAFDDVNQRARTGATTRERAIAYDGGKDAFLRSAFGRPVAVEKVQLIAARTFDEMANVTDDMANKMARSLADGLAAGKGPREVARDLAKQTDLSSERALLVARTEIVRAHAEGQLIALEHLGVTQLGVQVEWLTAGDGRVCDACSDLEGTVVDIEDAKGILPRHPNCRCAWVPAQVGEGNEVAQARKEPSPSLAEAVAETIRNSSPAAIAFDRYLLNAFCPTGPGGGVDPTCSPGSGNPKYPIKKQGWLAKKLAGANYDPRGDVLDKASKSLDSAKHLTSEQKTQYRAAITRVVESMPPEAGRQLAENLAGIEWHSSTEELTKDFNERNGGFKQGSYGGKYSNVNGSYSIDTRLAQLNGNTTKSDTPLEGGTVTNIHGVYAHELTHAIDGVGTYSTTDEWKAAYKEEIGKPGEPIRLTAYAQKKTFEGFAEFGRLLYGSDVPRSVVEEKFPKCLAFFKSKGLA